MEAKEVTILGTNVEWPTPSLVQRQGGETKTTASVRRILSLLH